MNYLVCVNICIYIYIQSRWVLCNFSTYNKNIY